MSINFLSSILMNHSENYFEILDSLQELVWICDLDATCTFLNKTAKRFFGTDIAAGPHLSAFFHSDDFGALQETIAVKFLDREMFSERVRLRQYDGEYRWHLLRMNPIRNHDDRYWMALAIDIEDEIRSEQELENSRHTLEAVLENSPSIVLINDFITFKCVFSNSALQRVLGFTKEYLNGLGTSVLDKHIHPKDIPALQKFLEELNNTDRNEDQRLLLRIKDADEKWHWFTMKTIVFRRYENGQVKEMMNYLQDISFLKETEERLKSSLRLIKQIAETSPDLILIYDYSVSKVIYSNQVLTCFGYSVDVLKNKDEYVMRLVIFKDDWPVYKEFLNSCETQPDPRVKEAEYRLINARGGMCWVRERARVFKLNSRGEVKQVLSVIQDITEKKKVEEGNRENELLSKLLEKKDEFMSVASHELKTPITTMKASIQIMRRLVEKHTDEKTLLVFLAKANQQINKLTSLIADLMDNARIQAGKMSLNSSVFSVAEIIEDCIAHVSENHVVTVKNPVNIELEGDRIRIEQVLTNFLSNAVKYSPQGKEIILDVAQEGEFVKISVTDFGIGIPEEKIPHLFDRFYRVDHKSQEFSGLGLGLYISAEIIKQHGGSYGANSRVGEGSTFWFTLPLKSRI